MSERKVLNKYYPPDFDPSKIPRMKLARNRQYTVRLMAPFNMRCKTCGEYIYKGKKFNARKEDVEGDDYLGIRIYRFYIKCTRCLQEISFKTDPKNTDYEIEAGATRNFMALKLAEEQAQREEDEEKEEEATNPMKLLEKRTLQSKQELELLESLEELKDLNRRQQAIDYDQMLEQFDTQAVKQRTEKEQEEYDEECIKSIFGKKFIVEEEIVELDGSESNEPPKKVIKTNESREENNKIPPIIDKDKPKDHQGTKPFEKSLWSENAGSSSASSSNKKNLLGVVKRKINLGTKVNTNPTAISAEKQEIQSVTTKETDASMEENKNVNKNTTENVHNLINNGHSGLSLLGAYSGSSDNDSD
ncbi:PREDICTED: coiled-coil domain-containing protein 94 [Habropoda laboriosa]|uniref:coiled-coil domain-containing protein 94 n=1 Tax=Habropoda laboriosa TaxID=597456 RepID=UPI00083E484E|nr:PREDICTED: coiled-coil domain-containing protein 94 [Habropoda laboriosa]